MKIIYKWHFQTPVHFGTASGLLSTSQQILHADTVFSALLQEMLKHRGETGLTQLVTAAREGQLRISDALPFLDIETNGYFFVPRPIVDEMPAFAESRYRKAYKALSHIPAGMLQQFLSCEDTPEGREMLQEIAALLAQLGDDALRFSVNLRDGAESLPYAIGSWQFAPGAGLYVIVEAEDAIQRQIYDLMGSLGLTGIGGKRSSGFGKFEVEDPIDLSEPYLDDLSALLAGIEACGTCKRVMSLSSALPQAEELESALEAATYQLVRRGGFTDSATFTNTPVRKQDMYLFSAGSVFQAPFRGDVYDIACGGGHPIYRYAKPLFMGVMA